MKSLAPFWWWAMVSSMGALALELSLGEPRASTVAIAQLCFMAGIVVGLASDQADES